MSDGNRWTDHGGQPKGVAIKAGQLNQAAQDFERVVQIWPDRIDTLKLLCDPRRGSDLEAIRSGISDPTPVQAFALQHYHELDDEIQATAIEVCGGVKRLWQLLNRVQGSFDSDKAWREQRCTGGMGMPGAEEWGDQQDDKPCEAVNHALGLCITHYMRYYRSEYWPKRKAG